VTETSLFYRVNALDGWSDSDKDRFSDRQTQSWQTDEIKI
jgi:hypothetical protein